MHTSPRPVALVTGASGGIGAAWLASWRGTAMTWFSPRAASRRWRHSPPSCAREALPRR